MIWRYFTDRDLGKQFPDILSDAGIAVERHSDLFPADGSDEQWLEHCGTTGRVAISHNSRIHYVPNELAAVVRFKVSLIIAIGRVPSGELARDFVASLNRIEAFLSANQPPVIAKLYRSTSGESQGRVDIWYPRR